jgi:ubiquinone/menaquinone biosynthesis C-methylase UbiE
MQENRKEANLRVEGLQESQESQNFFDSEMGKSWVEDEYAYQGKAVNVLIANLVIRFLGDKIHKQDRVKILSPSANIARVEADMLEEFKKQNVDVSFIVGDIADKINIDRRVSGINEMLYLNIDAAKLPLKNASVDILFEKKGFLLQLIDLAIRDNNKLVLKLLDEYFRVIKPGGAVLVDSIPDKFAYFTMDDYIQSIENKKEQEDWIKMTPEEKNNWIEENKKNRIAELRRTNLWNDIKDEYSKIGLEEKDTLLQKSSSTMVSLKFLMNRDSRFAELINEKYEFKSLGGEIDFLTAIVRK